MLTLPFRDNLGAKLPSTATRIALQGDVTQLCAEIATPNHAFATIYTIDGSETVLVHGCEGGALLVTRGVNGTAAKTWPANACFKINEIEPGAVCPSEVGGEDPCGPFDPVVSVPVGKGLVWVTDEAGVVRLSLAATGVVPTNMMCGEIDECGRIVSIPENWPASCLTPFDPCCDTGNGGGDSGACDISYATGSSSGILTATTVCDALDQLADYVAGLGSGGGAITLVEGACIDITGTSSSPVIGLAPTGITAGSYAGFQIDDCGRIVSYSAPEESTLAITGTGPINVALASGAYTIGIDTAGVGVLGVVKLADPAEAFNATPSVGDDDVITWEFLTGYLTAKGLI